MPQQTRKYDEDLCLRIGVAALDAPNVKAATKALHEGKLADLPAVPMPYSTVTYYAKQERKRREEAAQAEEEKLRPKPLDERIDAGARALLGMLESEIERMGKAKTKNVKAIGETAASLKKVRELAKPDQPSRPSQEDKRPSDPLTDALTRPSPEKPHRKKAKQTVAPNTTPKDNSEKNNGSSSETWDTMTSGVRARVADPVSDWLINSEVDGHKDGHDPLVMPHT